MRRMMQINDDYYEDLTPESTVQLLKALKDSVTISGYDVSKVPRPGRQKREDGQRSTCENVKGRTTLLEGDIRIKLGCGRTASCRVRTQRGTMVGTPLEHCIYHSRRFRNRRIEVDPGCALSFVQLTFAHHGESY